MTNSYPLILATDLDGTFLEGDAIIKNKIYKKLLDLREKIFLIYVTGRPIDTVKQFCTQGYLPFPHFVIGDHGTHIVDGINFTPLDALQDSIIQTWGSANQTIKELLSNEIGIELQPIDPPYRVAYYYAPDFLQPSTLDKITQAGFDVVLSCDMYLDIVPRGVSKGTSLVKLLNYVGLNHKNVVTCGDSLNDLSLFQTGLNSIAVGNSEPKLIHEAKQLSNVFISPQPGLYGIMDGLRFYQQAHLLELEHSAVP